tara:strand:+ start:215 stop:529 length:315 start_codon:yes stop_codon:yes gene_type:complete
MIVDITASEAYKLIKDCDVAKGWKQYAIEFLYNHLENQASNNCIDIVGALINWRHYASAKEIMHDYKEWEDVIDRSISFKTWADRDDPEADKEGYKTEYLTSDY